MQNFLAKYVFAACLVVILLLVSLVYYQDAYDPKAEEDLIATTKQIRLADLQLNQAVLMFRFGLKTDDSKVTDYLAELELHQAHLSQGKYALHTLQDKAIEKEFKIFSYQLAEKKRAIKQFRQQNSLFSTALEKFQQLSDQIIADMQIDIGIKNHIHHLQDLILQSLLDPANSYSPAKKIIADLGEFSKQYPLYNSQLTDLRQQIQLVFHYQTQIKNLLKKIIPAQEAQLGEKLEQDIVHYFERQRLQKDTLQNILFALSVFSVAYVVYLLFRLTEKSKHLHNVYAELEKQKFALDQHAIVSATDVKGNIIYVNQKFCDISGYTAEELAGKNHRLLKSDHHGKEVFKQMWRTISRGEVWHGEIKNRNREHGYYWVSATIVPFLNDKGKPYQYISIRTDITHQKNLEKQLQDGQHFLKQVTGTMAQGLYALDTSGFCTFWNNEAEHILDWSAEELLGQKFDNMISYYNEQGEKLNKQENPTWQSMFNNQTYSSESGCFMHKNGHLLPVAMTAVPLQEEDKVIGTVVVFNDISKRKADEKLLNQALLNAKQASQTKSDFLANMSHEIRTPMNAIIGMTDLALGTQLNEEQREYLEIVRDSSCALLGIINDILDFSKIEAGKIVLEKIGFNLTELLNKILLMLTQRAQQRGLQLSAEIDVEQELAALLIGDPGRLRQVLVNLIGNALKFTLHGKVEIKISVKEKNTKACCLLFAISDTGVGIPKDKFNTIFDSFSQADTSVTRRFGGTGLGLAISKQFIELMGGKIWLESQVDLGSTFFFTGWFGYQQPATIDSALMHDINTIPAEQDGVKMTATENNNKLVLEILLAEDNLINQKLAKKLLEKQGHIIHIANNGIEAVSLFQQRSFDLILMDFQMPEMNGLEATEKIRALEQERGGHIPIIAMTANAMKEDKDRALEVGMDAYVPKPINIQELLAQIAVFYPEKSTTAHSQTAIQEEDDGLRTCDWNAALKRLGGETEILEMMVKLFLEEHSGYLQAIHTALADQNAPVLERELHTLKGVCATVGAERAEKYTRQLEGLAKEQKFADISAALPQLEQHIAALVTLLEQKVNPA